MAKTSKEAPIFKKYAGKFVALSKDLKKVYGFGKSTKEALAMAIKKGHPDASLMLVPADIKSMYIL